MSKEVNVAVVIAVSEYGQNGLAHLPCCEKDGEAIKKLIECTGRFSEENIFTSIGQVNSNNLKLKLADFFAAKASLSIGEVFVYFSGHGDYNSDEFFYLLSDYSSKSLRQTSLEGSELDNFARTVSPKLYIKIVDACHSGLRYIKSREDFDAYVKKFAASFSHLYFMFSSMSDQFSYGGEDLSRFTRCIISFLLQTDKKSVRYKDLIDVASDSMASTGQTPYFVTQANFTEIFSPVNPQLKQELGKFVISQKEEVNISDKGDADDLLELIRIDAQRYATYDEAKAAVSTLSEHLTKIRLTETLARFYELEVATFDRSLTQLKGIGSWLEQNKNVEQYFAEPVYETKTRIKKLPSSSIGMLYLPGAKRDYEEIQEKYEELRSFQSTVEMPYLYISLNAKELFPNLDPARGYVVPIVSKTTMRVFWGWYLYDYIDWEKRRPRSHVEWRTEVIPLKADSKALSERIVQEFCVFLEDDLTTKWKKDKSRK